MNVLAVGAHPDDLEWGCFGTLAHHNIAGDNVFGLTLTKGDNGGDKSKREKEAIAASELIDMELHFGGFKDGMVRNDSEVISVIEDFVRNNHIDTIYCPSINDRHQDHRNTSLNVLVAGRVVDQIFAYESISSLSTFNPTMFVDVTETEGIKHEALNLHKSQAHRYYMPNDGLDVIHKFHSLKIGYPERSFEAFEVIKLIK